MFQPPLLSQKLKLFPLSVVLWEINRARESRMEFLERMILKRWLVKWATYEWSERAEIRKGGVIEAVVWRDSR